MPIAILAWTLSVVRVIRYAVHSNRKAQSAMLKARLFAIALILLSAFLIYVNWRDLWNEGTYSMKMAAFAPLIGIGGLYLLLFPSRGGKPNTTAEKVGALIVFVIGLLAGLLNWYLMDPGFFGFR